MLLGRGELGQEVLIALQRLGVDTIAVTGVNDVFVMDAWAKDTGGNGMFMAAWRKE
jgi:peroxiredoxin